MKKRRTLSIALVGLGLMALVAAGCGSGSGQDYGGQHPDYAKALAGSPPQLAALHEQANQLLPGGVAAFERRVAGLRGYPVVANVWASWCVPCRAEFPSLQSLSARFGKKVAFLGVNAEDSDDAAKTFLEEAPLSYPSYTDPDNQLVQDLHGRGGLPDTAFYGPDGEFCYLHQGQYADEAALEADIELYALGDGCESG